jgi:NodT family efflux transporter outer membrane factor (OMF) lipoprotein
MKMKRRIWTLTAALAALTGCASVTPPQAPPAAVVAERWQAPLPHGGSTGDLSRWWSQFDDPLLPALQAAAQQASPSLASARARIERARAIQAQATAAGLPRLDAVGSASTARSTPGQPTASALSAGLQAGWEIDWFGAVAAGRDAAAARLQGAQAGWHDARVSVAAEVAASYTALRACQAQLVQAQADSSSRAETARLAESSARAGFTAPADAALVRAGAAQARSLVLVQQAQCDTLVKGLVEITNLPEPELRQRLASGAAQLPKPAPLAVAGLPASLLQQRPDLADAAQAVLAAVGDQQQSRARERPQISLSGSLSAVALRSGGFSTDGSTWSIGPLVLSLPLFDGGARAASTAAARASYDEAVAVYAAAVRRAVREVETALVALDSTAAREVDALAAARDFEAALLGTQARQRGGLASLLDLEAARRNAVQAQSALIELQRERVAAWIALYRALGGGWNVGDPLALAAAPAADAAQTQADKKP